MKVLQLSLLAFGPFTGKGPLDLSAGSEGLHIVYGPNEAGKSSALRALRQLFYGIPERTRDDFLHPKPNLKIGARIRDREGRHELAFIRHKARKLTLTTADGETPLAQADVDRFLAHVDEGQFERQFGIDHAALVKGGEQFAQGSDLGELLFGAGLGSVNGVRPVQQALQAEMDGFFRPAGRNQKINRALIELRDAQHGLKNELLSSDDYLRHQDALKKAEDRRLKLETRREEVRRRLQHLTRVRAALKAIPRRKRLLEQLAHCADAVVVPEDFGQRWRTTAEKLHIAEHQANQARQAIARFDERLAQMEVPEAILSQAEGIEQLQERLGNHRKAMQDRPRLDGFRQGLEHEARQILSSLRGSPDLAGAAQLRISADQELRIRNLGIGSQALADSVAAASATMDRLTARIEQTQRQLQELSEPQDTRELRTIIDLVQQEGPLEKQCEKAVADLRRLEKQAHKGLASLPLWQGSLDELEVLAVPPAETIDRCESEHEDARSRLANLREQRHKADAEVRGRLDEIERVQARGPVPSEEDLAAARHGRDETWRLIRQAGTVDGRGADAYERNVEHADHLADRLRGEADRVTQLAVLRSELRKQTEQRDQLDKQIEAAEASIAQLQQDWRCLWKPLGIVPSPPKEMRTWLRRQNELAEKVQALGEQRLQVEALQGRIEGHRAALQAVLRRAGDSARLEATLALLLARAQESVEQTNQLQSTRGEHQRHLKALRTELREAEMACDQAVRRLDEWRTDWLQAIGGLGLRAEATPAEANARLADIATLVTALKDADGNRRRIEGIDRDAEHFTADVREVAGRVAPVLAALPVERACEDLKERLKQARVAAKERDDAQRFRDEELVQLRAAEEALQEERVRLDLLCGEAHCNQEDELAAAEQRSQERRQLERDLHFLDDQLLEQSGTQPLPEFLAVAEQTDPDTLDEELPRLETELNDLDKETKELNEAIGGEKKELERMRTSEGAAATAMDVESRIAQVQGDVAHYLVLRLASRVLQESIDRYRKKNENTVLARAGELFTRLTAGSFAGVRVEVEQDDKPALLGVRANGKDTVAVAGLSDGTCDQLYLALRLASLEDYLRMPSHEPLPFVVDDILLNFDDHRAVAALQALAELSCRTQVIFFTHHQHLVELAQRHLSEDTLFVHHL